MLFCNLCVVFYCYLYLFRKTQTLRLFLFITSYCKRLFVSFACLRSRLSFIVCYLTGFLKLYYSAFTKKDVDCFTNEQENQRNTQIIEESRIKLFVVRLANIEFEQFLIPYSILNIY